MTTGDTNHMPRHTIDDGATQTGGRSASQSWYWTPEWQKAEREADADIAAGRVKRFARVADLLRELHQP